MLWILVFFFSYAATDEITLKSSLIKLNKNFRIYKITNEIHKNLLRAKKLSLKTFQIVQKSFQRLNKILVKIKFKLQMTFNTFSTAMFLPSQEFFPSIKMPTFGLFNTTNLLWINEISEFSNKIFSNYVRPPTQKILNFFSKKSPKVFVTYSYFQLIYELFIEVIWTVIKVITIGITIGFITKIISDNIFTQNQSKKTEEKRGDTKVEDEGINKKLKILQEEVGQMGRELKEAKIKLEDHTTTYINVSYPLGIIFLITVIGFLYTRKADKSQLDTKADKSQLDTKADKSQLDTKANTSELKNMLEEIKNALNNTITNGSINNLEEKIKGFTIALGVDIEDIEDIENISRIKRGFLGSLLNSLTQIKKILGKKKKDTPEEENKSDQSEEGNKENPEDDEITDRITTTANNDDAGLISQVKDLKEAIQKLEEAIQKLENENINQVMDAIQVIQDAMQTTKNEMQANMERIKDEMQATKDEMQATKDDVGGIKNEMQATKNEMQTTKDDVGGIKNEMQATKNEMQTTKVDVEAMKSELLQKIEEKAQELARQITDHHTSNQAWKGQTDAMQNELKGRVDELEEKIGALQQNNDSRKIEEIEKKIGKIEIKKDKLNEFIERFPIELSYAKAEMHKQMTELYGTKSAEIDFNDFDKKIEKEKKKILEEIKEKVCEKIKSVMPDKEKKGFLNATHDFLLGKKQTFEKWIEECLKEELEYIDAILYNVHYSLEKIERTEMNIQKHKEEIIPHQSLDEWKKKGEDKKKEDEKNKIISRVEFFLNTIIAELNKVPEKMRIKAEASNNYLYNSQKDIDIMKEIINLLSGAFSNCCMQKEESKEGGMPKDFTKKVIIKKHRKYSGNN